MYKRVKKVVLGCLVSSMLLGTFNWMSRVLDKSYDVLAETIEVDQETTQDNGAENAVSDEIYEGFGINRTDPDLFTDSSDPLAGFESYPLNELYVGWMNKGDEGKFKGSSRLLETLSEGMDTANLDVTSKWPLAKNTKKHDYHYYSDKKDFEYQFNNAITFKGAKDQPALLFESFYGAGEAKDIESEKNANRYSRLMTQLSVREKIEIDENGHSTYSDYSRVGYDKTGATRHKILLADHSSKDDKFYDLLEVPADQTRGLSAMTAGDFNGDGLEEVAVYVPSICKDAGRDHGPYITFFGYEKSRGLYEHDGEKNPNELKPVKLQDLAISVKGTAGKEGWNSVIKDQINTALATSRWSDLPLVHLTKTTIAGNEQEENRVDDLVINVSMPEKFSGSHKESTLSIFSLYGNGQKKTELSEVYAQQFVGEKRFTYTAAEEADLNGDVVNELIVAGVNADNKNENLLQLITYEKNAADDGKENYYPVFKTPITIKKHSQIKTIQPIALAVGKYQNGSQMETIFIGGRLTNLDPNSLTVDRSKSQAIIFKNAEFTANGNELKLAGTTKAPFIHSASFARLSLAEGTEQLVTVSGDIASRENDVYMDIGFSWEKEGALYTDYTNNNLINEKDKDDHGTFLTAVPVDVDDDQLNLKYQGKNFGWTKPQIAAIMQANPYWKELPRHADANTFGATEFTLTTGQGHEESTDWRIGGNGSIKIGAGIEKAKGTVELEAVANYVKESSNQKQTTSSRTFSSLAEDSVVLFAQPIVNYRYEMFVSSEQGGTGEPEQLEVPITLAGTFGHVSLEQYHEVAKQAEGNLKKDSAQETGGYPVIDMAQILGTDYYHRGDPSTYQKIANRSKIPVAKEANYFEDDQQIGTYQEYDQSILITGNMEKEDGFELEIETESSKGEGWEVDAALNIGFKSETRWVEVEGSAGVQGGASQMWTDMSLSGTKFGFSYPSLVDPKDQDNIFGHNEGSAKITDYQYSVKPAVWRTSVTTNGVQTEAQVDGDIYLDNHPYVLGHLVSETPTDTLPPLAPIEFHVAKKATDKVELKWRNEAVDSVRSPQKYEIFQGLEDDLKGKYQKVGEVINNSDEEQSFMVQNLTPGKEYRFRIRSVRTASIGGEAMGKDHYIYSPLQPVATEENKLIDYLAVTTLSETSQLEFETIPNMNGDEGETIQLIAALTTPTENVRFDWNRYVPSLTSYDGKWAAITKEGVTENSDQSGTTLTIPDLTRSDGGYYHALASQIETGKFSVSNSFRLDVLNQKQRQATEPSVIGKLINREENTNQLISLPGLIDSYFLNDFSQLSVSAKVEGVASDGVVAFYLYRQDGSELMQTPKMALENGEVTTELQDLPIEDLRIVAVYFDQEHPAGIPAVAQSIYAKWPTEMTQTFEKIEPEATKQEEGTNTDQSYTVHYDLMSSEAKNHPDNPTSQQPFRAGLQLKEPTRLGYEFMGWYYQRQGDTSGNKVKATNQILGYADELTLEAKWQLKQFNIFYQAGEWQIPEGALDKYTIEQVRANHSLVHNPIKGFQKGQWFVDYARTRPFSKLSEDKLGSVFLSSPASATIETPGKHNYELAVSTGENGHVTVEIAGEKTQIAPASQQKLTVEAGTEADVSFTPATGYQVGKVSLNGVEMAVKNNQLKLTDIQTDQQLEVSFTTAETASTDSSNQSAGDPSQANKNTGNKSNSSSGTNSQGRYPQTNELLTAFSWLGVVLISFVFWKKYRDHQQNKGNKNEHQ